MWDYTVFLGISGAGFIALERLLPRRAQSVARPALGLDLVYLVFNAEVVGAVVAIWISRLLPADRILPWRQSLHLETLAQFSPWVQGVALLVTKDFFQWCVHNVLHRVPALWEFHKVHHSTEVMDWLSNWRFHWIEIVIYQTVLYIPATLLGFTPAAIFGCAVFSTTAGHYAHSNLRGSIGPLGYLFNNPEMHLWHHVHPDHGPQNRNFGISLSVWDWLFRTAYVPGRDPDRLGVKT